MQSLSEPLALIQTNLKLFLSIL